jgi:hypothetical protein
MSRIVIVILIYRHKPIDLIHAMDDLSKLKFAFHIVNLFKSASITY